MESSALPPILSAGELRRAIPLASRYEFLLELFAKQISAARKMLSRMTYSEERAFFQSVVYCLDDICSRLRLWAVGISFRTPTREGSALDVLSVIRSSGPQPATSILEALDKMVELVSYNTSDFVVGRALKERDLAYEYCRVLNENLLEQIKVLNTQTDAIRKTYEATRSNSQTKHIRRAIVLSFDGGGVKSYSSLLVIQEIMSCVKRLLIGNNSEAYRPFLEDRTEPCYFFDYIFGSSSGGLVAIMLGRLKMSVADSLSTFAKYSDQVFSSPRKFSLRGPLLYPHPKYSSHAFEHAIAEVVDVIDGDDKMLKENLFRAVEEPCRTAVLAYRGHRIAEMPYLFRTYDHWSDGRTSNTWPRNPGPAATMPIWMAARATTAAPTYFSPMKFESYDYIDGGFGVNNPSIEAFFEVEQMYAHYNKIQEPQEAHRPSSNIAGPEQWSESQAEMAINIAVSAIDNSSSGGEATATAASREVDTTELRSIGNLSQSEGATGPTLVAEDTAGPKPEAETPAKKPTEEMAQPSQTRPDLSSTRAISLFISIGSGGAPVKRFSDRGGILGALDLGKATIAIATESSTAHEALGRFADEKNFAYFRFSVPGLESVKLDDWKTKTRLNGERYSKTKAIIEDATSSYLRREEVQDQVHQCAEHLLRYRRSLP